MTITKWIATPQLVAKWRASWEERDMQLGMQRLYEKSMPVNEVIPPGVDIIHFYAIANAKREGFAMALRLMRTMARGIPESLDPEKDTGGWGDVDIGKPPQTSSEKQP